MIYIFMARQRRGPSDAVAYTIISLGFLLVARIGAC